MKKFILLFPMMSMSLFISAQDIKLPAPERTGGKPLMEALNERRSTREFRKDKDLPLTTLSNLLWAANGFNRPDKRTAPTANNRQELELFIAIKSGLYTYDAKNHVLKLVREGDYRKNTGTQDFVGDASLNVIFVSDLSKASSKNYAYTDCGFVSQNIYLFCASEGLNTVVRGSFNKEELGKLLNLPPNQEVLLTQSVGYPK